MKREGWALCEGKSIKASMVEQKVLDIVMTEILTPDRIRTL